MFALVGWVVLGAVVVAMVALLFQIDNRSRDIERLVKQLHEIGLRLEARREAES